MHKVNSKPKPRLTGQEDRERVVIAGAGLVGSLMSIYLARRGFQVEIFDKNKDPRRIDLSAQRSSINLSLSERAFIALDRVGVGDEVRALTRSTYGRLIHDRDGGLVYQTYGNNGEATYSIVRNELNAVLLDAAERDFGVRCHFQMKALDIDLETATLKLENTLTGAIQREKADRLIGADGAYSAIRFRLQKVKGFNFQQQYLGHGYKELNIPPGAKGGWTQRTDAVHLWPRGDHMLLGLPNPDDSFVCSIHMPLEGETSFDSFKSPEALLAFFESSFPDIVPEIPDLAHAFFDHPENHFISVRCYPWTYGERVALAGDSAHAIFPFFAQGTNAGFEDCIALDECLDEYGDDWRTVLDEYQKRRKPNADAISDMSRRHYREIRELAGDPDFQLRKKIENKLNELDPDRFMSQYTMVTFTSIPYAEALRRGREQDSVIDRLMTIEGIETKLDGEMAPLLEQVLASLPDGSLPAGKFASTW